MIVRIRLRAVPDKYVPKHRVTYALACDETRKQRKDLYYDETSNPRGQAYWYVPEHRANSWASIGVLRRTLSAAAWSHLKWFETTWSAYEVVHVDTGIVEPLDTLLMRDRGELGEPSHGRLDWWRNLHARFQHEHQEQVPYAVQEAIDLIPVSRQNQRQDSTTDQMVTVLELARRAGCYDAYDLIKRRCP